MIEIVKPTLGDIHEMFELVNDEVESGNILYRSEDEIATTIRSYFVAKENSKIIGFVALHIHTMKLAEIRSLIVAPTHRGQGVATQLIQSAIEEAKSFAIKQLLVLTYQQRMFETLGFVEIDKESLPENKIWTDCIKCKHFPVCNEVSLVKDI
jgi:amino-acid N-acetyltransferase